MTLGEGRKVLEKNQWNDRSQKLHDFGKNNKSYYTGFVRLSYFTTCRDTLLHHKLVSTNQEGG